MCPTVIMRLALSAALIFTGAAAAAAQSEEPTPEGTTWQLVSYAAGGELTQAPWNADATLRLEDGQATGSAGCNSFATAYELDADSLTFGEPIITTAGCSDPVMEVENGYMAALPETVRWAFDAGPTGERDLYLYDAAGDIILKFQQPSAGLTRADIGALSAVLDGQQAEIDGLTQRLSNVSIGALRDRVKELEVQVKQLQGVLAQLQKAGGSGALTTAEQVLLKGIPAAIRSTCVPLRGSNPTGTLAAVRCDPSTIVVDEVAYYLMPYAAAKRVFNAVMADHGVPQRHRCPAGKASRGLLAPSSGEGCFVDSGRANVRLIEMAADCHQLKVAGRQLSEPVIYVAIESGSDSIAPLFGWAKDSEGSKVTKAIPHAGQPVSPACDSGP